MTSLCSIVLNMFFCCLEHNLLQNILLKNGHQDARNFVPECLLAAALFERAKGSLPFLNCAPLPALPVVPLPVITGGLEAAHLRLPPSSFCKAAK